ncbi:MAG: hypothetical protein ACRCZF_25015, partial [Gemmataceae bacterium]
VVAAQTPPATPPATPPVATPAATPPAAAPAATGNDYYPIKTGGKWTYKVGDTTVIEMKVEKIEAGEATINTFVNNKQVASETIKVQADGVYRTKINNTKVEPPVKFLALPAKKDTTWEVNSKISVAGTEHTIKGKFTVKEEKQKEKIRDKDYETVVVDGPEFDIAGTKAAVKYWFAAGKGVVKLSYNIGGNEAILEIAE